MRVLHLRVGSWQGAAVEQFRNVDDDWWTGDARLYLRTAEGEWTGWNTSGNPLWVKASTGEWLLCGNLGEGGGCG